MRKKGEGEPEWERGREGDMEKIRKTRERYLASKPQADEERTNGDLGRGSRMSDSKGGEEEERDAEKDKKDSDGEKQLAGQGVGE